MKATRLLLVAGLLACGDRAPTGVNPFNRTSSAVTAAMADPRNSDRRRCWIRLRNAMVRSTNSLDMTPPYSSSAIACRGVTRMAIQAG